MTESGNSEPASVWSEEELVDGVRARCLTIILRTSGCSWWKRSGGCTMCGYNQKSSEKGVSGDDIIAQFGHAWKSFDKHSLVKIYTSGSFLDEGEVPISARNEILKTIGNSGSKLLIESRPEFVTERTVKDSLALCKSLEVALGLESANDKVLSTSIGKGFTFSDYEGAVKIAIESGAAVRTYLLLKPPFLTEDEAITDVLGSISKVSKHSRVISVNPVNVQRKTPLERLWKDWKYRPPWLWSVLEVLREAEPGKSMLIASTAGAGSDRGAHNCGECDENLILAIDGFNLTQDKRKLDKASCPCKEQWEGQRAIEPFAVSAANHERFFQR